MFGTTVVFDFQQLLLEKQQKAAGHSRLWIFDVKEATNKVSPNVHVNFLFSHNHSLQSFATPNKYNQPWFRK